MKEEERKAIDSLPDRQKSIIRNFSDYTQSLIAEKLREGYSIESCTSDEVELKMGFSYRCITRGGRSFAI